MGTTKLQAARVGIFFDRDGIVNYGSDGYITTPEAFRFRPDFFPLFQWVKSSGFRAIVVTNQQGVGKGVMTEEDLATIHRQMQQELQLRTGWQFDDIFACTALKEAGKADCHKPNPRMLLQAIAKWNLDPRFCWILGDQERDIEAGKRAGIHTCYVHPTDHLATAECNAPELLTALRLLQQWFDRNLQHLHQ